MSNLIIHQNSHKENNVHIAKQMIIRTCIQRSTLAKGCIHVQHTNMMQWEEQSIDTKLNSKHQKANKKTNIKRNK